MAKRLTYEYVKKQIESSFGYKLLSEEYKRAKDKIKIECPNNHAFFTTWDSWKSGVRCKKCHLDKRRNSFDFILEQFKKDGYKYIKGEYHDNNSKLTLECPNKHHYTTIWRTYKAGHRCPKCFQKTNYQEVKNFIESQGYKLHSKSYKNNRTKLKIECEKHHVFSMDWEHFSRGQRCARCQNKIVTKKDIVLKLKEARYTLLSPNYKNNRTKLEIRCDKGHIYKTTGSNVLQGCLCPMCRPNRKKTFEEIEELFKNAGYILLETEYINSRTKMRSLCPKKHIYLVNLEGFLNKKSRCPICMGNIVTHAKVEKHINKAGHTLLSKYEHNRKKMDLICDKGHSYRKHWSHLKDKVSCPVCAEHGFNPGKPGNLYYAKIELSEGTFYKIGITNNAPEIRVKQISPSAKMLWYKSFLFGNYAYEEEQKILKKYSKFLTKNPHIDINSGYTEIFVKDVLEKDVNYRASNST